VSALQSGGECLHALGGVQGGVDLVGLVNQVFQDGLVRLVTLGQDGVQQSLCRCIHIFLHSVAVVINGLGFGQSVHQLLPVGIGELVGFAHHHVCTANQLLQHSLVALLQAQAPDAFQQIVPRVIDFFHGSVGVIQ